MWLPGLRLQSCLGVSTRGSVVVIRAEAVLHCGTASLVGVPCKPYS